MMMVSVGLAIGAWALGRMQNEGGFSGKSNGGSGNGQGDASAGAPPGGPPPHGGGGQNGYTAGGGMPRSAPPPHGGYPGGGGAPPPQNGYGGGPGGWGSHSPPKPNGWQQRDETPPQPQSGGSRNTGANSGTHNTGSAQNNHNTNSDNANTNPRPEAKRSGPSGWERAREETRRKEEERKKAAELQRQKEEAERKLKEAREKEQREREAREAARERIAREAREARAARDAKLAQEKKEKEEAAKKTADAEAKAKAEAEKKKADAWAAAKAQAQAIQAKQAAARKKEAEEEAARKADAGIPTEKRQGTAYAYSAIGEKTNPWPRGYPAAAASVSATTTATPRAAPGSVAAAAAARNSPSPTKRPAPPAPNAKTFTGTEDSYSYRPYDTPKQPGHKKAASSIYSGTSYAESATTSATSPPPSMRGAYSTKDPDKIVIKAVYAFTNAFTRTPVTQLVSGTGSVTDGLILRITTEGLFIDDDVRHVPQREWDVKAWTLKLVEVGCPCFPSGFKTEKNQPVEKNRKLFGNNSKPKDQGLMNEAADALLAEFLGGCKDNCRLGLSPSSLGSSTRKSQGSQADIRASQTGQSAKLHVLRASIRDQEGKKYVFVIGEEEGWKIAVGLQRLRRGTQVRALAVSGMSKSDCAGTLTNLGWA